MKNKKGDWVSIMVGTIIALVFFGVLLLVIIKYGRGDMAAWLDKWFNWRKYG